MSNSMNMMVPGLMYIKVIAFSFLRKHPYKKAKNTLENFSPTLTSIKEKDPLKCKKKRFK